MLKVKKAILDIFMCVYTYMNKRIKVWKVTHKTVKSTWFSLKIGFEFGGSGKDYDLHFIFFCTVCVFNKEKIFAVSLQKLMIKIFKEEHFSKQSVFPLRG